MGQIATTITRPCVEVPGSDLYEIRCDFIDPTSVSFHRPVIYTDPTASEARLFELAALGPDYLTIDWAHTSFDKIRREFPDVKLIAAFHDFEKTQDDLDSLFEKLDRLPVDCIKVATWARSSIDALRMLQEVKQFRTKKQVVGLCMGHYGEVTRILAPLFGSAWTYAAPYEGEEVAPGQLTVETLRRVYRYHRLSSQTLLYGLIGDPVSYSIAHKSHNTLFDRLGVDGVYVKMCVKKEEVDIFLSLAFSLGFSGLSVTMPLKECVGKYLGKEGEAINTISKQQVGWNTDGEGTTMAIDFRKKKVVIVGAGGVANGIAKAVHLQGGKLTIVNRTYKRAVALAKQVGGEAFSLENFATVIEKGYDIVINATSQENPIASQLPNKIAMDVNNRSSPFLKEAAAIGCRCISGQELFINQAACQYHYWMGYNRGKLKALLEEIICG